MGLYDTNPSQVLNRPATFGTLVYYNGVYFDEIISSKVKSTPVYNRQNTKIKYIDHEFEIQSFVHPENFGGSGSTTDNALENLRLKLLEDRGEFIYAKKGWGDAFQIRYSSGGGYQDVGHGPKPKMLMFEPIAGNKSARIHWTVTVRTVECAGAVIPGIAEWWEAENRSYNRHGDTTYEIRGYMEVLPLSDRNRLRNQLSSQLDKLLLIGQTWLQTYHHSEVDFKFSDDGYSVDYTIRFEPIPSRNPYPTGIVEIQCSHSVNSELMGSNKWAKGFLTWLNNLDCTITLRRDVPGWRAWEVFSVIALTRLQYSFVLQQCKIDNQEEPVELISYPILLSLKAEEEIYGREFSFSISWFTKLKQDTEGNTQQVFLDNGMFQPVTVNTWNDWVQFNNAQYRFYLGNTGRPQVTNIVHPCNNTTISSDINLLEPPPGEIPSLSLFGIICPPPEASWLDYQNEYQIMTKNNVVKHICYKLPENIARDDSDLDGITPESRQYFLKTEQNTTQTEEDYKFQDFGNDTFKVRMIGYAIRMGSNTQPPFAKEIAGRKVRIIDDETTYSSSVNTSNANCPIYTNKWDIMYEVLGSPEGDLQTTREDSGGHERYP